MAFNIDDIIEEYSGVGNKEEDESPLSGIDEAIDFANKYTTQNNPPPFQAQGVPENHKMYDFAFEQSSKKYGIPKELFYAFLPVENNAANPDAEGPAIDNVNSEHFGTRAQGLFQIMPKTAERLNAKTGEARNPKNPVDNSDLFAQHIREALDRYGEDDIESAVVDFFSGPKGVELYRQGKGSTVNDSNLNIDEYAQKVIQNFKNLKSSAQPTVEGEEPPGPASVDDLIREYLGEEPAITEEKRGMFSGMFPGMSAEDKAYGAANPNLGGGDSDATAVITDPNIQEKYQTIAEGEGAATAGIKQALQTALFIDSPVAAERMKEHPVAGTVGAIAGTVAPMIVGGAGVAKGAAELPAMTRLLSAGKWGKVAHGAIVRGSTAAANWLARGGGDQVLSDDPKTKKDAVMNLTSTLAGSMISPLPETFAPKGALQLVLQPAVDALVETGVMASFGKNAWDKENIVNTLSQVTMSALFATNDLKNVPELSPKMVEGGYIPEPSGKVKFTEDGIEIGGPGKFVGPSFKEADANAKAVENYTNDIERQQREQIVGLYRGPNRDQRRAELESGMFSAEPEGPVAGRVREVFGDNIPTKGDVSKRFGVSRQEAATMIKDEYGKTFNTPKKTFIEKLEQEINKTPIKKVETDDDLPSFLRELETAKTDDVGAEASRATKIEKPGDTKESVRTLEEITAKLPEDLDPRTADEFDFAMAGINEKEIEVLRRDIDALDEERIAYEKQGVDIAEKTAVTDEVRAESAKDILTNVRKRLRDSSLDNKDVKEIDNYISGKSSKISSFNMDELRDVLSPSIEAMNEQKIDFESDYGKQHGEWDSDELIRFIQENSKAAPTYGKKRSKTGEVFSDQTGDLFGQTPEQQRVADYKLQKEAELAKKQKKDPLKGTMFDTEAEEAKRTKQETLFTKDDIKKKIDVISGGKMIGGQEAMLAGGTSPNSSKYAGSINTERTGVKAEVNKLMDDVFEHYTKNAEADERRPMSKDETQALANSLGMTQADILKRKKGSVWNYAEGKAARDINAASAERVYDLVQRNQKKMVDGTITENDKIELMQQWYLHAAVQAEVSKNASQSGRALRMHGFMADAASAKNKIKTLEGIMKGMGGGDATRGDYIVEKLMTLDPNDESQISKFTSKALTAKTSDKIYEAWISSLLSGIPTQLTNIGSNTVSIAYGTTLEKPTAAILDMIASATTGKKRERFMRETPQEIVGMIGGLKDAVKAFSATLKTGQASGPSKMFDGMIGREPAIKGKLGHVVRTPLRLLGAADEFFKTVIYRGEIQQRLYREARMKGMNSKEIGEYIAKNVNDPSEAIREAAWKNSLERTFNSPLGKFGNALIKARTESPGNSARWVVPFVKVPLNIAKFALERSPVVGQGMAYAKLRPKIKDKTITRGEIADEAAKSLVGTAVSMLVVGLAKAGLITGGGPRDKSERELLYSNGWLPYSFKIGDRYHSYARMEPIGSVVGIAADVAEMLTGDYDKGSFAESIVPKVVFAFAKNTVSKTFMTSISKAIDAVSEPERYGDDYVQSFAGTLVPNIIATGAKAVDGGKLREINSVGDAIVNRVPWAGSNLLTVKRDIWGNEIVNTSSDNWAEAMLSPIPTSKETTDKVDKERLAVGANIGRPGKRITYDGEQIVLDPQEYDFYQVEAGKKARTMVEALIKTSRYKNMSKEEKSEEIYASVAKARRRVRERTLKNYLKDSRK